MVSLPCSAEFYVTLLWTSLGHNLAPYQRPFCTACATHHDEGMRRAFVIHGQAHLRDRLDIAVSYLLHAPAELPRNGCMSGRACDFFSVDIVVCLQGPQLCLAE